MRTISLGKKAFDSLEHLKLEDGIMSCESEVYDFNYKGESKVLKALYQNFGREFANKLYTVEMLNDNKDYLPHNFVIPDNLVSVKGEAVGFTVPKIEGKNLSLILSDRSYDIKDQLNYLQKVGEIIKNLSNIRKYTDNEVIKSFFINDIHSSNFMVNPQNRELYVIDLDSCKIANNEVFIARYLSSPFSIINLNRKKYKLDERCDEEYGIILPSEQTDLYCYMVMILSYLYGKNISSFKIDEYYDYLLYLGSIGVDKELLDIFSNIITNKENVNPVDYLESLTPKQVVLSKEMNMKMNYKR